MDPCLPLGRGKSLADHLVQQGFQAVVVAVEIVEDAGRIQLPERHHGHDLCDLFQRPGAAGKRHECIAQLDHLRLALGHILRDDEFGQTVVLQLLFHKEPRFHPSHLPAGG